LNGETNVDASDTRSAPPRFTNLAGWQGFNIRDNAFWMRQRPYRGLAIASRTRLYFVVDPKRLHAYDSAAAGGAAGGLAAGGLIGGLVGALLGSLIGHLRSRSGDRTILPKSVPLVEELDLAELPAGITEHPDWPVEWDEGPVIVVPRDAVESLRTSFWVGGIDVDLAGVRIRIFTPLSRRKEMASRLADLGWDVEGL
jgi:hypothetical protein